MIDDPQSKPVRDVPIGTPATKCEDDGKHWNTSVLFDHSRFWKYSKAKIDREFRDAVCASLCVPAVLLTEPKTTPTKAKDVQTPAEAAAKRYSENKYGADLGSQLVRAADMATLANEYGWLKIVSDGRDKAINERNEAIKKNREVEKDCANMILNEKLLNDEVCRLDAKLCEVEKEKQILTATIAQRDESLAIARRLREDDRKVQRAFLANACTSKDATIQEQVRKIDVLTKANNNQFAKIMESERRIRNFESTINDLHGHIADARGVVANRDVEIEGLKEQVKEKEASLGVGRFLVEKQLEKIDKLEKRLNDQLHVINFLNND